MKKTGVVVNRRGELFVTVIQFERCLALRIKIDAAFERKRFGPACLSAALLLVALHDVRRPLVGRVGIEPCVAQCAPLP